MSKDRFCLACGGLDIICASCYVAVKGISSSGNIRGSDDTDGRYGSERRIGQF